MPIVLSQLTTYETGVSPAATLSHWGQASSRKQSECGMQSFKHPKTTSNVLVLNLSPTSRGNAPFAWNLSRALTSKRNQTSQVIRHLSKRHGIYFGVGELLSRPWISISVENSNEHSIWPYLNCELFMCTFHRVWTLSQRLHNCRHHNSNERSIWPYLNCKLFVCVFHRVWTLGQVLRSYSLFVNATSLAFTVFMYWVKYMSSAVSYDNSGYWTNLRENICLSSFIYLLYII